jgi:hypothetical protein
MDRKLAEVDRALLQALSDAERGLRDMGAKGSVLAHAHLSRCIAEIEGARRELTSASRAARRDRRF